MRLHPHAVIITGFQFIEPVAQVVNDLIFNTRQRIDLLLFILHFPGAFQVLRRIPLSGFNLIEQRSLLPGKILHQRIQLSGEIIVQPVDPRRKLSHLFTNQKHVVEHAIQFRQQRAAVLQYHRQLLPFCRRQPLAQPLYFIQMLDNLVAQLQPYRGIRRQQKFIELIDHQVEITFNQKSRMDARKILIQRIADLRTLLMP